jgi:hypothetical protein
MTLLCLAGGICAFYSFAPRFSGLARTVLPSMTLAENEAGRAVRTVLV